MKQGKMSSQEDLHSIFRNMIKDAVETIYEGELTETLEYEKYERKSKKDEEKEKKEDNARNGYGTKRAKSTFGEIDLSVPRDRNALYEPRIVLKRQKDISGIEEIIISMYAKGMTTTDIQNHMESIYGLDFSKESISRITDKVMEKAKEWQNRPRHPHNLVSIPLYQTPPHSSIPSPNLTTNI